jgi:hypothetical protein
LKGRLDEFVRSGEAWEGKIPFTPWGRVAHVALSGRTVEVTLKTIRYKEKNQKGRGSKGGTVRFPLEKNSGSVERNHESVV